MFSVSSIPTDTAKIPEGTTNIEYVDQSIIDKAINQWRQSMILWSKYCYYSILVVLSDD